MIRQVVHDGSGAFQVRFGFDRRLVDLIKTLPRRRWNASERFWWVPEEDVLSLVDLLHAESFGFCEITARLYRDRGGCAEVEGPAEVDGGSEPARDGGAAADYTVSRLNHEVRAVLEASFPRSLWLTGEVSGFDKGAHKRIVTFQLIERDASGAESAQVGATLFDDVRFRIERRLASAGGPFRIQDEIAVRARVRIDLYVPWGAYRVVVEDLDIDYTLGETARRREEIVRRLTMAGLGDRNRALRFPDLPLCIGLITSLGSDGCRDVLRTLEESGFAFQVVAHGARMQGRATESSVLNALDWFRDRVHDLDVVMICRGGGSRTDLAWLDSEALGRAVATFPLPVIVGIGHEQDMSVLDFMGWRCKTPTAAAAFLIDAVGRTHRRTEVHASALLVAAAHLLTGASRASVDRARRLVRSAVGHLGREAGELAHQRTRTVRGGRVVVATANRELRQHGPAIPAAASRFLVRRRTMLDAAVRQLTQGARRDLAAAGGAVGDRGATLRPCSLRLLGREGERQASRARRLHLVDPRRVIERGYAVLRAEDGRVVTGVEGAPPGTRLRAELRGGFVRLRSEGPAPDGAGGA